MTSFVLRCLALSTMIVDHMGYVLFPGLPWMRIVGRIAFPLYCFLLAQGFRHTRNVPEYGMRLALFAWLSEDVYNLVFSMPSALFAAHNVFFSLLLALGALTAWKHFITKRPLCALLSALAACVLAVVCQSDYGFWGILLCLCFYLAGDSKLHLSLALLGSLGAYTLYRFQMHAASARWIWMQWYCLLSLPVILLYNGRPGFRGGKWAFYALYPAHLFALWVISSSGKIH